MPAPVVNTWRYDTATDNGDNRTHSIVDRGKQQRGLAPARATDDADALIGRSPLECVDPGNEVFKRDALQRCGGAGRTEVRVGQCDEALTGQSIGILGMVAALGAPEHEDSTPWRGCGKREVAGARAGNHDTMLSS